MPAINFKKQFADAIREGSKGQTIRKRRKYPIKVGDSLTLYTGMRTKKCELLQMTTCTRIRKVLIEEVMDHLTDASDALGYRVFVDGKLLNRKQGTALASVDGFKSLDEFIEFFKRQYGFPLTAELIEWAP